MRFPLLVGLAATVLLASCGFDPPPGAAPLRYRDVLFQDVTTTSNVAYGSAVGSNGAAQSLTMDVFRPSGDSATNRPAVIWVHGGGFTGGSKQDGAAIATYLAQRGFVGASIEYRLTNSTQCAAQPDPKPEPCVNPSAAAQHDAQAAVRFLRKNASTYGIDPNRIALGGNSAGAITALRVATLPEDPGSSGNPGFSSAIKSAVSFSGGLPTNETITQGDAPTFFMHGNKDHTVPFDWAVSNVHAMLDAGVPAYLYPFVDKGHGLWGDSDIRPKAFEQIGYWLYYTLIDPTGAPTG